MTTVKCVVVGDVGVGKTTLIRRYIFGKKKSSRDISDEIVASQTVKKELKMDGKSLTFSITDTSGLQAFQQQRTSQYTTADLFLVCFSYVRPMTFAHVQTWISDIRKCTATAPIIIAGTHADLLNTHSKDQNISDMIELERLTKASVCPPCSGTSGLNVDEVFNTVLTIWMKWSNERQSVLTPAQNRYTIASPTGDSNREETYSTISKSESGSCRDYRSQSAEDFDADDGQFADKDPVYIDIPLRETEESIYIDPVATTANADQVSAQTSYEASDTYGTSAVI